MFIAVLPVLFSNCNAVQSGEKLKFLLDPRFSHLPRQINFLSKPEVRSSVSCATSCSLDVSCESFFFCPETLDCVLLAEVLDSNYMEDGGINGTLYMYYVTGTPKILTASERMFFFLYIAFYGWPIYPIPVNSVHKYPNCTKLPNCSWQITLVFIIK